MDKHSNFRKYIKYRMKYLYLVINNQIGGAKCQTIANSGRTQNMSNQCLRISIRDYLEYHLGIKITVRELKSNFGLGSEFDNTAFNEDNPKLLNAVNSLCIHYQLTLNFIVTETDGDIRPISLDSRGNMIPTGIINSGSTHQVYIASFGNHFELITHGPNGYELTKHDNSTISSSIYNPKTLNISGEYVRIDNKTPITEIQIAIIKIMSDLKIYHKELLISDKEIEDNTKAIRDLQKSGLSEEEITQLSKIYNDNISLSKQIKGSLCYRISELSKQLPGLNKKLVEANIITPPDIPPEDLSSNPMCAISNKYYIK